MLAVSLCLERALPSFAALAHAPPRRGCEGIAGRTGAVARGATTAAWALEENVVDKVLFFYAPMILGGDGRVMIDTLGVKRIRQAVRITDMQVRRSGRDTLVSGYVGTG